VGLDLFVRTEAEPLIESTSTVVDMQDAKSERLSLGSRLLHQPANDRRADAASLPREDAAVAPLSVYVEVLVAEANYALRASVPRECGKEEADRLDADVLETAAVGELELGGVVDVQEAARGERGSRAPASS
jgi:hypothetical protein